MAKKQKNKVKSKQVPTKRQLSRWQREERTRRIIIIVVAVFLAGIIGYAGYSHYNSEFKPLRETVIEVNDTSFNMGYYVNMLEAYTKDMEPTYVYYMVDQVAKEIEEIELMRQGANDMGIKVTDGEIDSKIKENELPDNKIYRDIVAAGLLGDKLQEYFDAQLPDEMEQVHIQVMLVESREAAEHVMGEIENGGNFTALVEEFSYDAGSKGNGGDLGWLPGELMPKAIADTFKLMPGEVSQAIYHATAVKGVGYWLIKVTEENEEKGINALAMLLGTELEAREIKDKLASENFTALAGERSQHESGGKGGELGWLKRGDMGSSAFDEVAFNFTLNEVAGPVKDETVQTEGGYWIVKILEKREHELSEEVRMELTGNNFFEWLQEQRATSVIGNYLDENRKVWAVEKVLGGR